MRTSYLIQRAKFLKQDEYTKTRKGIDRLLRFDYMGSAEFEFGALPKSLGKIRAEIKNYIQFEYSFAVAPTKTVTVFCKSEDKEVVCETLEKLVKNEIRLKEYCDLSKFVLDVAESWANDFWWDILNDFMFWKTNSEFEVEFKKEINPL